MIKGLPRGVVLILGLLVVTPAYAVEGALPTALQATQAPDPLMPDFQLLGDLRPVSYNESHAVRDFPQPCCPPIWAHRTGFYASLMLLRARDAEVAFALPVNNNVPVGATGLLDPEFDLGYQIGFRKAFEDQHSSLSLNYSGFFSEQNQRLAGDGALFSLSKLLVHPNEANAAADALLAIGQYEIDFQTVDLDYRFVVISNQCTAANFTIGARYGRLDQELAVQYSGAGLTELVTSDIEFNGLGLRLGGDIEHHGRHGLFCYGKTAASFLAGEVKADFLHSSNVDPLRVANSWDAGRLVSILELEVGAGWQCTSNCKLSAGYTFSNWMGVAKTDQWIDKVQADSAGDLDGDLTFDGFVFNAEYRF